MIECNTFAKLLKMNFDKKRIKKSLVNLNDLYVLKISLIKFKNRLHSKFVRVKYIGGLRYMELEIYKTEPSQLPLIPKIPQEINLYENRIIFALFQKLSCTEYFLEFHLQTQSFKCFRIL